MDMTVWLMVICFLLSAFFSGSETVLISASRIKIEVWQRQNRHGARKALDFFKEPSRFLSTTLVGNSIAMVAVSSLMAVFLEASFSGFQITLISSLFLLFFGEILPKSIARDKANSLFIPVYFGLNLFYWILWPLIVFISWLSSGVLRMLGLEQEAVRRVFSRHDLNFLLEREQKSGNIDMDELDMISRLVLKGNESVHDVMAPRIDIISIEKETDVDELSKLIAKTGFSRIPVFDQTIDQIVGVVTAKDVLLEMPQKAADILRPVIFVPESRSIVSVLAELKEKQMVMAIVIDEYGGTEGLVTLEDCVEAFVGDIHDEHDADDVYFRNETINQIEVHSRTPVDILNAHYGNILPDGDYQTVGGLLFDRFAHIPKQGERLEEADCFIEVLSASKNKVHWIRLTRKAISEWPETSSDEM